MRLDASTSVNTTQSAESVFFMAVGLVGRTPVTLREWARMQPTTALLPPFFSYARRGQPPSIQAKRL